jgi:predicted phage gp36 major capsid-like protein
MEIAMLDIRTIAQARRIAADPANHIKNRAEMRAAFFTLKEARGQIVTAERRARLGAPHHIISAGPETERTADAIREDTIPRIHHFMRRRGFMPGGGDAA